MEYVLQLQNISRIYNNGIVANKNINLDVMKGEIHAIVGENGAGKSTLMKMIYGMERPNSGAILINGKEVNFASSQDAINMSVGMVHQHFMLMQSLTVGENLIINTKFSKYGILSDEQIDKITSEQCQKYGFNLNSRDVVSSLSVGNQQQLEILKALYRGAKILILDEPTAVLTPQETKKLFEQLIYLKSIGHTILFISHKLGEVMEISDRISVLRQGTIVSTHLKKDVNPELLSNLIVGKAFNEKIDKPQQVKGAKQLQISNLHYINKGAAVLNGVNLDVYGGEILGICGIEGNGQHELIQIITTEVKNYVGNVTIFGEDVKKLNRYKLRKLGVCHIPEDRIKDGLSKDSSIKENLISTLYVNNKYTRKKFFLDFTAISNLAKNQIAEYEIKAEDGDDIVSMLSGGNMQKVVAAREFLDNPKFVIVDQPTRGVDIGASKIIREHIVSLRNSGSGVALVSADLSELISISDRIVVFFNGNIVAEFTDMQNLKEESLGVYMLGLKNMFSEVKK